MSNEQRQVQRPPEWPRSGFYWHPDYRSLYGWIFDIDECWNHIITRYPKAMLQRQLGRIHPVQNVPDLLVKVGESYDKVQRDYEKVGTREEALLSDYDKLGPVWDSAREQYDKARTEVDVNYRAVQSECAVEMGALHELECPDCPWDGMTLFPIPPDICGENERMRTHLMLQRLSEEQEKTNAEKRSSEW